eukprot:TRINITY_DN1098_c0_g1_i2.p1 TRINITY_DN1098_c0_g1~~TRINITY_DN1098_c0_g1_i2.p1  ORF type:complete len:1504 (-),score=536.96 TRINITY_DN1098_c0_g1_i2:1410-5921(-)
MQFNGKENSDPFYFSLFSFHSLKKEKENSIPSSPSLLQSSHQKKLNVEEILQFILEEIICYKTISSLSECLVHSPHKIHQLYWTLQRRLAFQEKSRRDFEDSNEEATQNTIRIEEEQKSKRSNRREKKNRIAPWNQRVREHFEVQWKLFVEELVSNQISNVEESDEIRLEDSNRLISKITSYHYSLFEGFQCWKERNNLDTPQGTCKRQILMNGEAINPVSFLKRVRNPPSLSPLLQSFVESDLTNSMMSLLDPNGPCNYDDINWWSLFHNEEKRSPFEHSTKVEKTFLEPIGLEVIFVMIKNMSGILHLQWISFLISLFLFRIWNFSLGSSFTESFTILSGFIPFDCTLIFGLSIIDYYVIRKHCNPIYSKTLPNITSNLRIFFGISSFLCWFMDFSLFLGFYHWTFRILDLFVWILLERSQPLVKGRSKTNDRNGSTLQNLNRNFLFLGFTLLIGIFLQISILMPTLHSLDHQATCSFKSSSPSSISTEINLKISFLFEIFTGNSIGNGREGHSYRWICTIGHLGILISVFMASMLMSGISFVISTSLFGFVLGAMKKRTIPIFDPKKNLFDLNENLNGISRFFFGRMENEEEKRKNSKSLWNFYVDNLRKYDFIDNFEEISLKKESGIVDLSSFSPFSRENLTFWSHSLRCRRPEDKFPTWEDIPSVSTIIPCLNETIFSSSASDSLFEEIMHLKSVYPLEWRNFIERIQLKISEITPLSLKTLREDRSDLYFQLRLWTSFRSQTVSRTIRGANSYFDALNLLRASFFPNESAELRRTQCKSKFQLILAHQTFSSQEKESREEILGLIDLFPQLEIVIPWELEVNSPSKDISASNSHVSSLENQLMERFGSDLEGLRTIDPRRKYASICLRGIQCGKSIVLSKRYPLLIGETQGKAANQRNALLFATKEIIQTLDANQDAFAGECLKIPVVLQSFEREKGIPSHRIVGFTENIFTERLSLVGKFHSRQEWTFSTISQRVYSFLGVRMHYGHPDFFDAGWVSSSGLSKASAKINLSEDIFAGFETKLRGESICHVEDVCNFGKGRETNLAGVSKFETKISEGAASILRSRDMFEMMSRLNLTDQFLIFHSSVGHFLTNSLLIHSIRCYLLSLSLVALSCFFYSSSSSPTFQHFNTITLSLFGLGWIFVLPLCFELILNHGIMNGLLKFLEDLPFSSLFHIFQAQTKHCAFSDSLYNGNANYRRTGRNLGNQHETLDEIYSSFVKSHFHPAFHTLLFVLLLYFSLGSFNRIPLGTLLLTASSFLFIPILLNPSRNSQCDLNELTSFWKKWLLPEGKQLDKYWFQREKQDFSFGLLNGRDGKAEKHWESGILFHFVKILLWTFLLWEGYQIFKTWMDLFAPCWLIHIVMTTFAWSSPKFKGTRRGLSVIFFLIFMWKGIDSIQRFGLDFTGAGLISCIMISKGFLSSSRFILLSFAAKKWRQNEFKFEESYHFISIITLTKVERWIEAAIWSSTSFATNYIWSPISTYFLFGQSFWKSGLLMN